MTKAKFFFNGTVLLGVGDEILRRRIASTKTPQALFHEEDNVNVEARGETGATGIEITMVDGFLGGKAEMRRIGVDLISMGDVSGTSGGVCGPVFCLIEIKSTPLGTKCRFYFLAII